MDKLSKDKMDALKNSLQLTNKDIAQKTGLPISTIDKLFSGINTNPTLGTLKLIAEIFNCSIDDFMEYERETVSRCYFDNKTSEIAQNINKNPTLKELFYTCQKLSNEDIRAIIEITNRLIANRNQ